MLFFKEKYEYISLIRQNKMKAISNVFYYRYFILCYPLYVLFIVVLYFVIIQIKITKLIIIFKCIWACGYGEIEHIFFNFNVTTLCIIFVFWKTICIPRVILSGHPHTLITTFYSATY